MKEFFSEIRRAIVSTLILTTVCCGFYPLIVYGLSQTFFHDKANGSLIVGSDGMSAAPGCSAKVLRIRNTFTPVLPLRAMATMQPPPVAAILVQLLRNSPTQ